MTSQQIARFNPAQVKNLSEEDMQFLRTISDSDLKILAETYPNGSNSSAYILMHNSAEKKNQLFPRTTYQNLYNLRVKNDRKNFTIHDFFERQRANAIKAQQSAQEPANPGDISKEAGLALLNKQGDDAPPKPVLQVAQEITGQQQSAQEPAKEIGEGDQRDAITKNEPDAGNAEGQKPVQQEIASGESEKPFEDLTGAAAKHAEENAKKEAAKEGKKATPKKTGDAFQ